MDFSTLNTNQLKAVMFNNGPALIIAGAGSGKTKTLVYRVARLIDDGISPNSILLLSFTRKAANEILTRASKLSNPKCQYVSGGTFHSFCHSLIKRFHHLINYSNSFSIFDRSESEDLINLIRKDYVSSTIDLPNKSTLSNLLSHCFNTESSLESYLIDNYPQFVNAIELITTIFNQYKIRKMELSVFDYDDLLSFSKLLLTHKEVQDFVQNSYRYVMIDEYQDTNNIQADIVSNLLTKEQNIMAVGDDCQSIYSFRGANISHILNFSEQFKNTTIIKLEQNYRSVQPILDLSNEVIKFHSSAISKSLYSDFKSTQKPFYIESKNEWDQAKFIVQKIQDLLIQGTSLSDIAVLMRSSWHSNDLEIELKKSDIPFIKVGGSKFIEASHIKDIMAYFKIISNSKDIISWSRVLMLIEGVGPKTVSELLNIIPNLNNQSINQLLNKYKSKKFFSELNKLFTFFNNSIKSPASVTELFEKVFDLNLPYFEKKYDDYLKRSLDLNNLKTIASRYTLLEDFITELTLDPIDSLSTNPNDNSVLTLTTIHSAKGLEWNTVFIISIIDGYLPSSKSFDNNEKEQEELRLLYVAITRAKLNLFIFKPQQTKSFSSSTNSMTTQHSRFLMEDKTLNLMETSFIEEDYQTGLLELNSSFETYPKLNFDQLSNSTKPSTSIKYNL
ncbi:hypothetical protein DID75_02390 [Candidatus Marinamargulisbacteria bacterium SCGC AG-410-N11]|nr:hypothetical protein DID75_02390 [Candidatus Marinamargulisbacteria bacterium SCGC AG-410-N11]